ncbi:MAG: MgtC/SapB family protein [Hyphomicrobiaceae bacterium]
MTDLDLGQFCFRVGIAALCGLIIGLDREFKSKPLGARAYIIICAGTAALLVVTIQVASDIAQGNAGVSIDPSRVISGIVGGIGFLGAGAVISGQSEGRLRGVGSGSAIWATGVVGILAGLGYLAQSVILAMLIFCVLFIFDWLHERTSLGQSD